MSESASEIVHKMGEIRTDDNEQSIILRAAALIGYMDAKIEVYERPSETKAEIAKGGLLLG